MAPVAICAERQLRKHGLSETVLDYRRGRSNIPQCIQIPKPQGPPNRFGSDVAGLSNVGFTADVRLLASVAYFIRHLEMT